jgi:hypothetical protein
MSRFFFLGLFIISHQHSIKTHSTLKLKRAQHNNVIIPQKGIFSGTSIREIHTTKSGATRKESPLQTKRSGNP